MAVHNRAGAETLKQLGFKRVALPAANMPKKDEADIALVPVRRLSEVLELLGKV